MRCAKSRNTGGGSPCQALGGDPWVAKFLPGVRRLIQERRGGKALLESDLERLGGVNRS